MHKRVVTGVLAAAVAGAVLAPATAALAEPASSLSVQADRHGRPEVGRPSAEPGTVTAPERGTVKVSIRARVEVRTERAEVVLDGPDFRQVRMTKLERTAGPNGLYGGTIEVPSDARPGEWRYTVEATDDRGRTGSANGTLTVRSDERAPEIARVGADRRTAVLTGDGAKVGVEAVVRDHPDSVRLSFDGESVRMKHVGGDRYRADAWLAPDTDPGKARLEVRAYGSGGSDRASTWVQVRRQAGFTGFNASPEPVRHGKKITVKGTLKGLTASGSRRGLPGTKVTILFKPQGSSSYRAVKVTRTAGGGAFKVKLTAKRSGTWKAVFDGNGVHAGATSAGDRVAVQG